MNDAGDAPRPILLPLNLASFALLGGFLTCSDALVAGQTVAGGLFLRFFFGGGTLIVAATAWKLWMRRREAWKWFMASLAVGAIAFFTFQALKERERALVARTDDEEGAPLMDNSAAGDAKDDEETNGEGDAAEDTQPKD